MNTITDIYVEQNFDFSKISNEERIHVKIHSVLWNAPEVVIMNRDIVDYILQYPWKNFHAYPSKHGGIMVDLPNSASGTQKNVFRREAEIIRDIRKWIQGFYIKKATGIWAMPE